MKKFIRQSRGILLRLVVFCMASTSAYAADYVPGMLYVKYVPAIARTAGGSPETAIAALGGYDNRQAFPDVNLLAARKAAPEQMERRESLASIRRIRFPEDTDMVLIARKLSADPGIEYAEPVWIDHICRLPNDTGYDNQEYLSFVNAPQAWDIATGDSTVVIAIIDTGTDWQHPDLVANVWTNPGEIPGDGLDNDGNDLDDDIHGWDFYGSNGYNGDADPRPTTNPHGTHVAGIAAAVTDNSAGIASLSYNVRYLPIKAGPGNTDEIYNGFEALLYAAACGADIANCSWGSYYYSRTNQTVVETVAGEGVLIVAAAGNNENDVRFYPAAYPDVLAVGAVTLDGDKSYYSSYGMYVDIAAPGNMIYSTMLNGTYATQSGTSMAAPVVSALAALVKSYYPDADSDQIQAQILGSAQPLASTEYDMGAGYVDALGALTEPVSYMRVVHSSFSDSTNIYGDGIFRSGELLDLTLDIRNLGIPAEGIVVTAEPRNGYLTAISSAQTVGSLAHGEETTVSGLRFMVDNSAPVDADEVITFTFTASGLPVGTGMATVRVNPSFATFAANTLELSFNSNGNLGFVDYPDNWTGASFVVRNDQASDQNEAYEPLIFEAGFMIGAGADHVSDVVRGDEGDLPQDTDLIPASVITFETDGSDSSETGIVSFSDTGADAYGVTVDFTGYAFTDEAVDQCLILTYLIRNTGQQFLTGMRAGLFIDFDMPSWSPLDDVIEYVEQDGIISVTGDLTERLGKVTAGITAVPGFGSPWLINNGYEDGDIQSEEPLPFFGIYDGFTEAEKWQALEGHEIALPSISGADVSCVAAVPAFDLTPGEEHQIAFVLGYGLGYNDLKEQLMNGRSLVADIVTMIEEPEHHSRPEVFGIVGSYPNPFNPATTIEYASPADTVGEIAVYSITGQKVRTLLSGSIEAGYSTVRWDGCDDYGEQVATGVYLIRLSTADAESVHRVTLMK